MSHSGNRCATIFFGSNGVNRNQAGDGNAVPGNRDLLSRGDPLK